MADNPDFSKLGAPIAFKQVVTDDKGDSVEFEWQEEWVTPELCAAVGRVVLDWVMLDHELTKMCELSLRNPEDRLPREFDKRATIIGAFASVLYEKEPEELETFNWFLQRLKTANGKRDELAHGRPGRITKRDRQFFGLLVPFPSRDDTYIPMRLADIERLSAEMKFLQRQMTAMSYPLWAARQFALTGRPIRQVANGSMPATVHSRSPKLPRLKLPPSTSKG